MIPKLKHILCNLLYCLNDRIYLKLIFKLRMGKSLNFSNCQTFNEKLQWLKLYNRQELLTSLVDKIKVKEYIGEIIGNKYIVPTLLVWNSTKEISEIDIESLPQAFVVKTNHSGGNTGVEIFTDKSKINIKLLRKKMNSSLKTDIYKLFREWPYKNVEKKIFVEEYLGSDITDYKFFCFNGYVDSVMICTDRDSGDTKYYFFNKDWNLLKYNIRGKQAPDDFSLPRPKNLGKMFEIASLLSKGFPFVRIDLYNIEGNIYFGEMTFFPASGLDKNLLPETDKYFGKLININRR